MNATTLGIDLSADPTKTAVCSIDWRDDGKGEIILLRKGSKQNPWNDEALLAIIETSDKAGIDAPFGWPMPFVDEVKGWMSKSKTPGEPFSADSFEKFRLRKTDLRIEKPRRPLSVSSDRIAVTAMRCARLISATGNVDRTGAKGKLMEIYPASALSFWGLRGEGYKDGKRQEREELMTDLSKQLNKVCRLSSEHIDECVKHHDCLDALIASLVVRAFLLGQTSTPESQDEKAAAPTEGWLHVPTCQLSEF